MRIFGLTLIEIVIIMCMTGTVSAMGMESISNAHTQANTTSLEQLKSAINAMNTQVYSLAMVENIARKPNAKMKLSNIELDLQYGFIKDKNGINAIFEQTLLELGTLSKIKDMNEYSESYDCVLYYQAPKQFGSQASITINSQGC